MSRLVFPLGAMLAVWPAWPWIWRRTWDPSGEPWGLVALIVALAVVARALRGRPPVGLNRGWAIAATSTLLLYTVLLGRAPMLVTSGVALLAVGAAVLAALQEPSRGAGLPPLLLLALPLAPSLQFYLGLPLRELAGRGAAMLLSVGGIDATARGTGLLVEGRELYFDPACAGARMLWGGLLLAVGLGTWRGVGPRGLTLLGFAALALALAGNAWRSAALALLEVRLGGAGEAVHEGVGLVVFGAFCLLLVMGIPVGRRRCVS